MGVSIHSKQRSIPPSGDRFPNVELVATLRDWNARVHGRNGYGEHSAIRRTRRWCVRKNEHQARRLSNAARVSTLLDATS